MAPNRTQTFVYDELDRIKTATSTVYGTITYQYDQIGNITYNSRVGSYKYDDPAHIHAVTKAGSYSYQYDANGNMTTRNEKTITYDYDNRATSISGTSSTVTNVYDYSGQRVKKNSTIYIGKLYECNNGVCTKHIFAGSQRVASKKSQTEVNYYHTDHLGSSTVITNASGGKEQETYYYPFGETRVSTGSATNYKYTGQEEDPETGLYYYGARYYDPIIGRFISADTIVPNFADPQSLNRYSYCGNNPIIYTDPNGHVFWLVPILIGAAVGAASAAITDGNILLGALTGAISGAIFFGAGELIHGAELAGSAFSAMEQAGIHAAAGGLSGGINAAITGGNIGLGMLTGGISGGLAKYAGGFLPKDFGSQFVGRSMIGGVTGGITAEIYGGDFGQGFTLGAGTAAIGYLCNEMVHAVKNRFFVVSQRAGVPIIYDRETGKTGFPNEFSEYKDPFIEATKSLAIDAAKAADKTLHLPVTEIVDSIPPGVQTGTPVDKWLNIYQVVKWSWDKAKEWILGPKK